MKAKEVIKELEEMMQEDSKRTINWEMSGDQGPWEKKIKVSLWFIENTGLQYMIAAMKGMREEMAKRQYKVNGYFVKFNLEQDPKSAPLRKATAMFFMARKEAQGDEKKN